ncbi:unnamed protein product, partial [Rotaria magnacalcarata]
MHNTLLIIIAKPTPEKIKLGLSTLLFPSNLPCHPLARMNAVAGPRLENWPRANS